MAKHVVVIGTQWGDEGKGKIVDWLTGTTLQLFHVSVQLNGLDDDVGDTSHRRMLTRKCSLTSKLGCKSPRSGEYQVNCE